MELSPQNRQYKAMFSFALPKAQKDKNFQSFCLRSLSDMSKFGAEQQSTNFSRKSKNYKVFKTISLKDESVSLDT